MLFKYVNSIFEQEEKSNHIKAWLFILPIFIYFSIIIFPYLLADDLWLIYSRPSTPSLKFISIAQGRPFFALIVLLIRSITENINPPHLLFIAISILRVVALFCISIFCIIVFDWLKKWGWSSLNALICVAIFISLPSVQLYIANGEWVAFGVLNAGLSIYFLDQYFFITSKVRKRWCFCMIFITLLCAWSTYQITPFFMAALLLAPILTLDKEKTLLSRKFNFLSTRMQIIILGFICFFLTMFLYLGCWVWVKQFFPEFLSGDKRYDLTFNNFRDYFFSIATYFFTIRLPQILNLWFVDSFKPHFSAILVCMILIGGLIFKNREKRWYKNIFWIVLQVTFSADFCFF